MLQLYHSIHPKRLAVNVSGGPRFIGDVYVHSSVTIDCTAVVGHHWYYWGIVRTSLRGPITKDASPLWALSADFKVINITYRGILYVHVLQYFIRESLIRIQVPRYL